MLIKDKSIAIVGGGPGGLTLARLLQLKGVNVKVFERDLNKNARVQGAPLDLHDNSGLAAIRKADLLEEFKQNYLVGADRELIVNENAEIFFSDHDSKPEEDFGHRHFRPEIDRGTLRKILLESLQPETVVWDSHFVSMEKQNEGWLLHFKNNTTVYADIVIACDGANSKIRPYITDYKAFYTGIIMLEGNILQAKENAPKVNALLKGGKIMAFGNKKNLLMGQKGNGDIGFYASFKTDESWVTNSGLDYNDKAQMLDWFKSTYPEWNPMWLELFENAETPFIPRPIYCIPFDQTWEAQSNVTLIGDAAHVMPPFAGEGVNMAMLDALELSESLTSDQYKTLQEAISGYEIQMRKRAALIAKESLDNGELMHAENALENMLNFFNGPHE
ncbi:MAG: 2-polyprenyl-6-methoxyphenol hydroxylase [Chryseobacterium sp.]|uniref:FAD-dependent oxidoreductase n=1 Tax=Chryseobacterium sp. TaxID=1871047 RepID=UPI000DB6F39B|nr:NAD(P)/FAD-dependent oxidoreductase [Chryseobacterium sp.]MPS66651.1 FAD-dependent monooxygenase [Chryseobacterium sp.]PZU15249.1 MAG: 2-polyprenyl-6-methoxyphenol hydroxylase [Chryseobacterium sp.]